MKFAEPWARQYFMVEVAGVEPASEKVLAQVSTSVSSIKCFA